MMVDFYWGSVLMCLNMPSLMERLEEFLILLLECFILYCCLVVLSFQLINFSLKSKSFSFLLLLLRTRHKGVSFWVLWLP